LTDSFIIASRPDREANSEISLWKMGGVVIHRGGCNIKP